MANFLTDAENALWSLIEADPGPVKTFFETLNAAFPGRSAAFTGAAGETITSVAHGLADRVRLRLSTTGTLPAPLAISTDYYVGSTATDTFKLSLTSGGLPITMTDAGSGAHTWLEMVLTFPGDLKRYKSTDQPPHGGSFESDDVALTILHTGAVATPTQFGEEWKPLKMTVFGMLRVPNATRDLLHEFAQSVSDALEKCRFTLPQTAFDVIQSKALKLIDPTDNREGTLEFELAVSCLAHRNVSF